MRDSDFGSRWRRGGAVYEQGARLRLDGSPVHFRSATPWDQRPIHVRGFLRRQKLRVHRRFRRPHKRSGEFSMVACCRGQVRPKGGVEVPRAEQAVALGRDGFRLRAQCHRNPASHPENVRARLRLCSGRALHLSLDACGPFAYGVM
jgi:hypothetical protein